MGFWIAAFAGMAGLATFCATLVSAGYWPGSLKRFAAPLMIAGAVVAGLSAFLSISSTGLGSRAASAFATSLEGRWCTGYNDAGRRYTVNVRVLDEQLIVDGDFLLGISGRHVALGVNERGELETWHGGEIWRWRFDYFDNELGHGRTLYIASREPLSGVGGGNSIGRCAEQ
jgi:hypothetical protein